MGKTPKSTMTLNLRAEEMERLEQYATEFDMSKTAVMRSALRLYDLVQHRLRAGESMSFSGDHARHVEFVGPDFPQRSSQALSEGEQNG